jgi:gas vesicle protein GvpL/GvpF
MQVVKPRERSGAAFLAAKKEARDRTRDAVRQVSNVVETAYDLLAPLSRDSRRRTDFPESAAAPPLLDAAFLVPAARKARFRAAARRAAAACRAAGLELTLTGPWPAYNFVQPASQSPHPRP